MSTIIKVPMLFEVDIDVLNDVIHEVVWFITNGNFISESVSMTDNQLKLIFLTLPEKIQLDAYYWGMGDTEVRDSAYSHIIENIEEFKEFFKYEEKV